MWQWQIAGHAGLGMAREGLHRHLARASLALWVIPQLQPMNWSELRGQEGLHRILSDVKWLFVTWGVG